MMKSLAKMVILGSVFTATQALAWGDLGHEIVGGLAEQMIEPATADFLREILGIEPLAVSAVFPDEVRDDQRFAHNDPDHTKHDADDHDFSEYHFCEIPPGYTYDTKPVKDIKDCYGAVQGSLALLRDTSGKTTRAEKLIAIRYVVHIMGDIAQPLHVGNTHDVGGNLCYVKFQANPQVPTTTETNLHSFWDGPMVTYLGKTYADSSDPKNKIPAASYYPAFLKAFKRTHPEMLTPAAKAQYAQGDMKSWLLESQAIRDGGLYPDAPNAMKDVPVGEEYRHRLYCQWLNDQKSNERPSNGPILSANEPVIGLDYQKKYAPIVETQLIKAGLRLAAVLDQVAQDVAKQTLSLKVMTDNQQEAVIKRVQSQFRNK